MPTYGYQCNDCKHEFSVFQAMKDDPIAICPQCTGSVKRLLYPVGVVFKGSGWYINDSRKPEKAEGNGEKGEKGEKAETGKTESASDTSKSDSAKPDTVKSDTSGDKSSDKSKPAPATASASSDK